MPPKLGIRYTPACLRALEAMLRKTSYSLYYGQGSFRSGACVMHDEKALVLNKFLPLETRIDFLYAFLQKEGIWAANNKPSKDKQS